MSQSITTTTTSTTAAVTTTGTTAATITTTIITITRAIDHHLIAPHATRQAATTHPTATFHHRHEVSSKEHWMPVTCAGTTLTSASSWTTITTLPASPRTPRTPDLSSRHRGIHCGLVVSTCTYSPCRPTVLSLSFLPFAMRLSPASSLLCPLLMLVFTTGCSAAGAAGDDASLRPRRPAADGRGNRLCSLVFPFLSLLSRHYEEFITAIIRQPHS